MLKTGIDISSQRITKLEKDVIKTVLDLPRNSVCVDLGAGHGWLGIVLVFLHQQVYFIDKKINWKLRILKKLFGLKNMILIQKDIRQMNYQDFPDNITVVYSARFLHYLKYEETEKLLKILKKKIRKGNPRNLEKRLFFSVSGIESELGKNYIGKDKKKEERFNFLSVENKQKFQIREKVTLYQKQELENLFSQYFQVKEIWQSNFGNIFLEGGLKE